jgi:N-acetylglucosaminyldiphosphoundecaprenol N-acetyl-beta-D-mannosaminyltransferase
MQDKMNHPIAVLGLPLAHVTLDQAVDRIEELITKEGTHQVATANLDFWLKSNGDSHLHRIIAGCDLVVADGMPLVWASNLLGEPLPERVTGVDIVPRLMALSATKGYKIFLLGGGEGVGERVRTMFEAREPNVQICGVFSPPVAELNEMDHSEIVDRVRAAKPDILLVGFGNPKQEKWIWMHKKRMGVPVSIGIGGSMDILVGDVKRAPRWMQRCGLEWLMRLLQEPRRLAPRYVQDFFGLVSRLPLALAATWTQRAYDGPTTTSRSEDSIFLHLHIAGSVSGRLAPVINRAVEDCTADMRMLCIHFDNVVHVDPSGMGLVLDARRRLLEAGLTLQSTRVPARLRFLLYAWCIRPLMDELTPRTMPIVTKESQPAMNITKN